MRQPPAVRLDAAAVNRPLRGRVAIAGAATYGCGEAPGLDDMALLARAAQAAVADAGLTMRDIDGIATCSINASMWAMPVIEHLGLNPTYIDSTQLGGSSFVAHLLPAVRALQAGQCNAVLVCYGSAQRTATFGRRESMAARRFLDPHPFEHPYEPPLPVAAYALAAARHMHEYGTTRAQLAEVAVAARAWAQLNPEAFLREPLTLEQALAARPVASPLTVRDCCLVTDGAGAIVLTRSERARDLPRPPVYVLGSATAVWHRQISCMHQLTRTAAVQSGAQAYAMAGLAPADMDMAQLYDAFTINTLLFLEDLGFCAKGEGGAFVQGGAIAPGGRLAVNTNGGGLSCVHPGMYGIFALVEAVRQLRGEAGERQLARHRTAVVHGNGGTLSSQATAVLGTHDAL
ncbi:thiolase [Pulveribacter suum]|uniref:thiolase n=1 Tax=Pulveribacter suum TaxID=2116657 RepID=UPI001D03F37E|nr:thiolase [Pulveribacter suum]